MHSRFKILLNIDNKAICSVTKQSKTSKHLQRTSQIIWDKVSMTKRKPVKALDSSIQDIMGRCDLPFREVAVVFGGDFRQVLSCCSQGDETIDNQCDIA